MLLENDRFLDQTGNENTFQYFDRKSFWGFPKTGLEHLRIIFSTELQTLSEKSGSKNQIFYSFICWNILILKKRNKIKYYEGEFWWLTFQGTACHKAFTGLQNGKSSSRKCLGKTQYFLKRVYPRVFKNGKMKIFHTCQKNKFTKPPSLEAFWLGSQFIQ